MEAEVDFGELWVRLAGVLVKCYLFAFRMSYSGKAVHLVSATCGQEAFLEGHVHAFAVLGGVPAGQIRYDNLTPAVTRVLRKGRARIENPRWTAFRSHYKAVPASSPSLLAPGAAAGQRADLGSSGHRYRFEHSWRFFVIPEISSAISGVFPDS